MKAPRLPAAFNRSLSLRLLFFAGTAIALALIAAWLFVVSRIAHAWIHCNSNYVPNRRRMFTVGWWVLVAMAMLVAWELGKRALGYGPV